MVSSLVSISIQGQQNSIEHIVNQNIQQVTRLPVELCEVTLDYLADDLYVKASCNENALSKHRVVLLKDCKSITFINNALTDHFFLSLRYQFPKLEEMHMRNCTLQFRPQFGCAPCSPLPFSRLQTVVFSRLELTSYSLSVLKQSFLAVNTVSFDMCTLDNQGITMNIAQRCFPEVSKIAACYDEEKKEEKEERIVKSMGDLSL